MIRAGRGAYVRVRCQCSSSIYASFTSAVYIDATDLTHFFQLSSRRTAGQLRQTPGTRKCQRASSPSPAIGRRHPDVPSHEVMVARERPSACIFTTATPSMLA